MFCHPYNIVTRLIEICFKKISIYERLLRRLISQFTV